MLRPCAERQESAPIIAAVDVVAGAVRCKLRIRSFLVRYAAGMNIRCNVVALLASVDTSVPRCCSLSFLWTELRVRTTAAAAAMSRRISSPKRQRCEPISGLLFVIGSHLSALYCRAGMEYRHVIIRPGLSGISAGNAVAYTITAPYLVLLWVISLDFSACIACVCFSLFLFS